MSRSVDLVVPAISHSVTGIVDHGCEFEGKLSFHGTVRIGGVFKGDIITPDTLIIAEGARVQAQIEAGVVILSGELQGTIRAKHRVEIHRPAVFRGTIVTPSLKVDEGVVFDGNTKMVHPPAEAKI